MAGRGAALRGKEFFAMLKSTRLGMAWPGKAGRGKARNFRHVESTGHGAARLGVAGHGVARQGKDYSSSLESARRGAARPGVARRGSARLGKARHGFFNHIHKGQLNEKSQSRFDRT